MSKIKSITVTSTTTANGTMSANIPLTKPIISVWTKDADATTGAYTVTPEANRASSVWHFHIRKGIATNAVVANESVTLHIAYIDEDIIS